MNDLKHMTLDEKKAYYAEQMKQGNARGIANFDHFLNAHENGDTVTYAKALEEVKAGCKSSHWMWYIFPQIAGIPGGHSERTLHYGISNELQAYLYMQEPTLRQHMLEILGALLEQKDKSGILNIMGSDIDARKLRSSMTLFWVATREQIFLDVLEAFFGKNEFCPLTLDILRKQRAAQQ